MDKGQVESSGWQESVPGRYKRMRVAKGGPPEVGGAVPTRPPWAFVIWGMVVEARTQHQPEPELARARLARTPTRHEQILVSWPELRARTCSESVEAELAPAERDRSQVRLEGTQSWGGWAGVRSPVRVDTCRRPRWIVTGLGPRGLPPRPLRSRLHQPVCRLTRLTRPRGTAHQAVVQQSPGWAGLRWGGVGPL